MRLPTELEDALRRYSRKGGKTARRRQVARVRQFLAWCAAQGVKSPQQVGKRHVHDWLDEAGSEANRRDRYYSIRLLWDLMGRGEPVFVDYRSSTNSNL